MTALAFPVFTAVCAKVVYQPLFAEGEGYESLGFGYEICQFDDGKEYAKIVGYDPVILLCIRQVICAECLLK